MFGVFVGVGVVAGAVGVGVFAVVAGVVAGVAVVAGVGAGSVGAAGAAGVAGLSFAIKSLALKPSPILKVSESAPGSLGA